MYMDQFDQSDKSCHLSTSASQRRWSDSAMQESKCVYILDRKSRQRQVLSSHASARPWGEAAQDLEVQADQVAQGGRQDRPATPTERIPFTLIRRPQATAGDIGVHHTILRQDIKEEAVMVMDANPVRP
jgi:hypothetical protein